MHAEHSVTQQELIILFYASIHTAALIELWLIIVRNGPKTTKLFFTLQR